MHIFGSDNFTVITSVSAFPLDAQVAEKRKIFEFGASHFHIRPVKSVSVVGHNNVRLKFLKTIDISNHKGIQNLSWQWSVGKIKNLYVQ